MNPVNIDFKIAFEAMPGYSALLDIDGPKYTIIATTDEYLKPSGRPKTSILGKGLFEAFPKSPIDPDFLGEKNLLASFERVIETKTADQLPIQRYDIPDANNNFREYYWRATNKPVLDADGNVRYIIHTAEDVTDKVKAEQQQEEIEKNEKSESLNRLLIEESTVAIALYIGPELKIQYANETMLHYWGKDSSVIGKTLREAVPELIGQPYLAFFEEVYTTGVAHVGVEDEAELNVDGELQSFYYNYTYKPLKYPNGEVYGIHQTAIDVTEQVLAKKALKKSEHDFRQLADTLPEMVWTTDAVGAQTFASKRWQEFTGLDPYDEVTFQKMIHPDDAERIFHQWTECLRSGNSYKSEVRIKSKNGDYQWFYVDGECIRNEQGDIEKWVGAYTNINQQKIAQTELQEVLLKIQENEKRLENMVKERTHDLSEAKRFLEENNAVLQAMNKELESFAYISSHDLQEPLRKIQTFASRIMETDLHRLSQDGKTYFGRIQNAGLRMQTLIDDLLAYSRTNRESRSFEKISLGDIIEEIKEEIYEDISVYNATIETTDMCDVHIISFQFRQLMHNLIGNALKFSKHDSPPHITIKCHTDFGQKLNSQLNPDRKYCHISISDNGIGFEPEYGERIFEVFQRLHGKDKYNGTGIGLAIVKKIIENHEGIITATGELGKGATFDIYIPSVDEVIIL